MTGIGVAISTTGDEHRLDLLIRCVGNWRKAIGYGTPLVVTVDGDERAAARAALAVSEWTASIYRVGQGADVREGRMGVAVNKNTGIDLLMDSGVQHLFLSDDDTWPLFSASVTKHGEFEWPHSMVSWGSHRMDPKSFGRHVTWTWPRGVMLYQHRSVIEQVGGMDERFGLGGHEHAEFSRRIHQAGLTPTPFLSPASYGTRNAMGAAALWHCEDMPRPHEPLAHFRARKRRLTTINPDRDWDTINRVMAERDGDTSKVPYQAYLNGRESATLVTN